MSSFTLVTREGANHRICGNVAHADHPRGWVHVTGGDVWRMPLVRDLPRLHRVYACLGHTPSNEPRRK